MKYIGFPRPSYPLAAIVERVGIVFCKWLSKRKKEKKNSPVLIEKKDYSTDY